MATANSTRAREIQVEHYHWGHWAKGTRDLLIQHGYAQAGPFPGDPGVKKTTCDSLDQQGRAIRIKRASKTTFSVSRDWSDEEKSWYDRRAAQKAEAERAARLREEETQRAIQLVDSWPKTGDDFRDTARKWADVNLGMLEGMLLDGTRGGFRYDDETTRRILLMLDGMFELVETAPIVMDFEARKRAMPYCLANTQHTVESAKPDNILHIPRVK